MQASEIDDAVRVYLGDTSWDDDAIDSATAAERRAQAKTCRVPSSEDADWDEDLVEALCRRVAHNLALRRLPLGVQASVSGDGVATNRVGGTDAEVRRLEAPFRKVVLR